MKQNTVKIYISLFIFVFIVCTPKVHAGFADELLTNLRAIFVQSGNVLGQTTDMYSKGSQQVQNNSMWSQTDVAPPKQQMVRDEVRRTTGTFQPPELYRPSWTPPSGYPTPMFRRWVTGYPLPTGFRWPTRMPIPTSRHTIQTLGEQISKNGPAAITAHMSAYRELVQKMYMRRNKLAETGADITKIDQYLRTMDEKISTLEKIAQDALLSTQSLDTSNGQAVSQYVTTWTTQMKSSSQELLAIAKLLNAEFKRKSTSSQ